jgi:predicted kinase|nr:MAG TPA: polynucleotide kinase [Caudoviricetes sp.]
MKLLLLRGLPASGKTTFAKELVRNDGNWVRVNKDDLRNMLNGGKWSSGRESLVVLLESRLVRHALKSGKNVVIDNTNFNLAHERRYREIAKQYNADFEIKEFDTPLEECIKRDNARPNGVGETVIRKMYDTYLKPAPAFYSPGLFLQPAIICDIDGTLAHMHNRSPYDWSKVGEDKADISISWLVNALSASVSVILVSGRDECCRKETENWLSENCVHYTRLLMRKAGDNRPDEVVKKEMFNMAIRDTYNVRLVLDDRNKVVDMWRQMGLKCLQVAEGDF